MSVARSLLFLGCRGPEIDLLYADELAGWSEIVDVEYAFSRVADEKRYVQDALRERADAVWDLLQRGAAVFVCGNAATMAPAVRAALQDVFRAKTGTSAADAEAWLAGLRGANRFLEDIWGT
jgi:cytochrome P450/NADPH-cytochrome P450 reductase